MPGNVLDWIIAGAAGAEEKPGRKSSLHQFPIFQTFFGPFRRENNFFFLPVSDSEISGAETQRGPHALGIRCQLRTSRKLGRSFELGNRGARRCRGTGGPGAAFDTIRKRSPDGTRPVCGLLGPLRFHVSDQVRRRLYDPENIINLIGIIQSSAPGRVGKFSEISKTFIIAIFFIPPFRNFINLIPRWRSFNLPLFFF